MPAKHLGRQWRREYLMGFGQAAHDIALGLMRPWLRSGIALTPFLLGYRAGWREVRS